MQGRSVADNGLIVAFSVRQLAVGMLLTSAYQRCTYSQSDEENTAVTPCCSLGKQCQGNAHAGTDEPEAGAKCGVTGIADSYSAYQNKGNTQ